MSSRRCFRRRHMCIHGSGDTARSPLAVVCTTPVRCAGCGRPGTSPALGLCDGLGTGRKTLYFEVEVYDRALRRRALGSFSDLYQLALRGVQ